MRQQTYFLLGFLVALLVAYPLVARGMGQTTTGETVLSKEEVAAIVDTIDKQTERIKALEKRLTTCFNNT